MNNLSREGFIRPFSPISLQRKFLLFIVVALSFIFASSSLFIYKLVNDTFMESEKRHIAIISDSLSLKVGVWYFINNESENFQMEKFLKNMLISYKLEYIAFRDKNGVLLSEIKTPKYSSGDPYNVEYEKIVYSPQSGDSQNRIGTLEIAYNHHLLQELSSKYYTTGVLLVSLLALYFYLEMRLLKELLTPLRRVASEIKRYMPGDRLVFESNTGNRGDEISEIVNGFLQMQNNIDDAMQKREMEEEKNKIKDAILLKQSRFIEMGTMISNIAHQWRQPLNIIELCITDLTIKSMLGELDTQHQEKLFHDMHLQVEFMSKTIDIFKNFLNDDQSNKKMEIFSIKSAIEETMQLLGSTLEKKKIEVEFNLDEKACTYGSISELEQAVLIILNNAIDTLSSKITIECISEKESNIIRIKDNGGGFDPAVIDNVFDAYFTTKHQAQGTGLGLFIAKMIIEVKFHGTIEALNFEDGALLVIKLPLPAKNPIQEKL